MASVVESLNYADLDALHAAIGEGHVSARSVAQRLAKELRGGEHEEQLPTTVRQPRRSTGGGIGVHVEGLDDVMVRLSRCCTPVPGDEIIGFVTRGRGVSVHRADCANASALSSEEVGPAHRGRVGPRAAAATSRPRSSSRPWTAAGWGSTCGRSSPSTT